LGSTADQLMDYEVIVTTLSTVSLEYKRMKETFDAMEESCKQAKGYKRPYSTSSFPLFITCWSYLFADEVQGITNTEANTTEAVCALRGDRRCGVTGMPLPNDYHNIHALVTFLKIKDGALFRKVRQLHPQLNRTNPF
jgi:SNF2 family DNA or RNA helicase